ncbi:hypothetical protein BDP27DRAFT_590628 [Rhodocollybia butyracea]|uniref:Uncharacterized protein n=1 Tax=Rhodocollybia butyracea TaxID=206335 RepID=A0A9P5UA20_9AGAR|nr:hypothetical protein BDP27DRAFT_590628 [Rhodocollybia butyracea]
MKPSCFPCLGFLCLGSPHFSQSIFHRPFSAFVALFLLHLPRRGTAPSSILCVHFPDMLPIDPFFQHSPLRVCEPLAREPRPELLVVRGPVLRRGFCFCRCVSPWIRPGLPFLVELIHRNVKKLPVVPRPHAPPHTRPVLTQRVEALEHKHTQACGLGQFRDCFGEPVHVKDSISWKIGFAHCILDAQSDLLSVLGPELHIGVDIEHGMIRRGKIEHGLGMGKHGGSVYGVPLGTVRE